MVHDSLEVAGMGFDSFSKRVVPIWRGCAQSLPWGLSALVGAREEIPVERHRYEGLVIYEVTSDEIENIKTETLKIPEDLTFAIAGFSIGVSFLIVLLTVDIVSARIFQVFFILCLLGFIVGIYCGFRWLRGRRTFESTIKRIERRVGPLGQEGKEKTIGSAGATGPAATGATGATGAPGTVEVKSGIVG